MLSPGSTVSVDSIISALINKQLDPELGPQYLKRAVQILQDVYTKDLRAYFFTKPFYTVAGVMDFPTKVKDTYIELNKLTEQPWTKDIGFLALEQIRQLVYSETDTGETLPVCSKLFSTLLSLDVNEVAKHLVKNHLRVDFKYALESAVNAAKIPPPPVTFNKLDSDSGRSTPKSAVTDIDEFDNPRHSSSVAYSVD